MLANGKVLVTGGWIGSTSISSSKLYDPLIGTWTTTGSMNTIRHWHATALLTNGKVLITGGLSGSFYPNSTELYDPLIGTWATTGSIINTRYLHTAN
ncbi:unnamed protein product, partial [Rotaria sp. Silwood2]